MIQGEFGAYQKNWGNIPAGSRKGGGRYLPLPNRIYTVCSACTWVLGVFLCMEQQFFKSFLAQVMLNFAGVCRSGLLAHAQADKEFRQQLVAAVRYQAILEASSLLRYY